MRSFHISPRSFVHKDMNERKEEKDAKKWALKHRVADKSKYRTVLLTIQESSSLLLHFVGGIL